MGNCLQGLSKCIEEIKDGGNSGAYEPKMDQILLKRIIMLEERIIEQDMDMKSLKAILSRLELRRLEDKEKIRAIGTSIKKLKRVPPLDRSISWKDDEDRITKVSEAIKDLKQKLDMYMQSSLLRNINNKDNHAKDENVYLVDALEKGIRQGHKHLANLEQLVAPLSILMETQNSSLRRLAPDNYDHDTTASL